MISAGIIVFIVLPVVLGFWVLHSVAMEYRRDRIPILLYHRLISRKAAEAG